MNQNKHWLIDWSIDCLTGRLCWFVWIQRSWHASAWSHRFLARPIKDTGQVVSVELAAALSHSSGRPLQEPRLTSVTRTGPLVNRTVRMIARCAFSWRRHDTAVSAGTIWTAHGRCVPCANWICEDPLTSVLDRIGSAVGNNGLAHYNTKSLDINSETYSIFLCSNSGWHYRE